MRCQFALWRKPRTLREDTFAQHFLKSQYQELSHTVLVSRRYRRKAEFETALLKAPHIGMLSDNERFVNRPEGLDR